MLKFAPIMANIQETTPHAGLEGASKGARPASRQRRLFGRPAMWILTLLVSLTGFCWPFFNSAQDWSPALVYLFLFAAWGIVIIFIALIAGNSEPAATNRDRKAGD